MPIKEQQREERAAAAPAQPEHKTKEERARGVKRSASLHECSYGQKKRYPKGFPLYMYADEAEEVKREEGEVTVEEEEEMKEEEVEVKEEKVEVQMKVKREEAQALMADRGYIAQCHWARDMRLARDVSWREREEWLRELAEERRNVLAELGYEVRRA
ncbi:hypothetical protein EJ03DRAFT_372010 [Teratosphaeria nubilosa]|uniref:Uncharacterized protein n=1 Tax=Teratosphaeria nubilosa TaxID=161662 RepID=A0A6G1LI03_9PEZI|nr:hypothetical protein EJ03DRAFT_372010 [Teratosphaeria nubilosa]